ncbi:MAG: sulfide/dihydroorotate dehydrogenase-like FAD/NAD-binding protein [Candidatus Lokiarchaeota archaeon]|nr:sulfide/dihydroorotate dehydrogenase-like FAD/NAD-binding protein [Candidatus Lokiarchaeota archaeon]
MLYLRKQTKLRWSQKTLQDKKSSLKIDGREVKFVEGQTVLEVALENNIYIPNLCYIDGIPPYGGCRLCIVKIEGMKGYPTACSTTARQNMIIITKDEELQNLRKEILKLILIEHPNSCLICDNRDNCEDCRHVKNKSGRVFGCFSCPNQNICKLKEIINYLEIKETQYELQYKFLPLERDDPFFERDYNLCILCGRCVRICNELRGIGAIQFINRGCETRVSSVYNLPHIDTNCQFCGACVDICPTGALIEKNMKWTSKDKIYKSSICGFCSLGCGFNYSSMAGIIIESLPNINNNVNRGQACVIGRFCTASFNNGKDRLKYPILRKDKYLIPVNWDEIYYAIHKNLKKYSPSEIAFFVSSELSCEAAYLLNQLSDNLFESENICINGGKSIHIFYNLLEKHFNVKKLPRSYNQIESSSWILLINSNIQVSHPVLMIRLNKAKKQGKKIIAINFEESKISNIVKRMLDFELNLSETDLYFFLLILIKNLLQKSSKGPNKFDNLNELNSFLQNVKIPNSIIKNKKINEIISILTGDLNGTIILGHLEDLTSNLYENIVGILFNYIILSNKLLNFIPLWRNGNLEGVYHQFSSKKLKSKESLLQDIRDGKIKAIYLTERIEEPDILKNVEFVILQDIYLSDTLNHANIVLPASTFLEDTGSFINSELNIQIYDKCALKPGLARSDWEIFRDIGSLFQAEESNDFSFKDNNEILMRINQINPFYQNIKNEELNDSLSKANFFIPCLIDGATEHLDETFTLNSIKYRGERITNKVADLAELNEYKNLEKLPKYPQVIKIKQSSDGYEVISNREIAPNMYEMIIKAPLIASKAQPGNFIIIMKDETSERIPISLSDCDIDKGTITIIFQERGFSTKELTEMQGGNHLFSVVGPLGKEIEMKNFGTILLGGGCYGIGALYPIAKKAKEFGNKVIVLLEARNKDLFFMEEKYKKLVDRVIYCTSDGSKGLKGKIETGIESLLKEGVKIDRCYFIGCNYMIMDASNFTKYHHHIPTYVSLNTIMIDGTGMCGGCRFTYIDGDKEITKFACVDGPIFDGHKIKWEDIISRETQFYDTEILVYQNHSCQAIERFLERQNKSGELNE